MVRVGIRALSDHTELFDGVKSVQPGRRGTQRDAGYRASAATHRMNGFGPPKAGFLRPLDVAMLRLWSARPRREACLASKREKPVKWLCVIGKCFSSLLVAAGVVLHPVTASATSEEERNKICAKAEARYQKLFGKPSADEDVVIVKMYKYTFCPIHIEIKQGETVRWVNVDRRTSHSVWLKEAGKPESDRLFSEEKVEMTFDLPAGDYPYLCGPHWKEEGMTGRVTVIK